MKTKRSFYVAFTIALVCLSIGAVTQKDVNESCSGDSDCDSKHCVTVEGGGRKCSDCDQDKLGRLTDAVGEKCKGYGSGVFSYAELEREFGSKNNVSLIALNYRAKWVRECLEARLERENTCWDGGDSEHKSEIEKLKKASNYLQGLIDEKTRNNLAYNCEPDRFEDLQEDINDDCKEVDNLFAKYVRDEGREVSCSEISDLLDKTINCRDALEDMVDNCFRSGAPGDRVKRLEEVREMERRAKEKKEKICR